MTATAARNGIDSFTAYFSSASVEQVAALAKMSDPVAGTYTKEVGRHNLDVQQFDGQTTIACSYTCAGPGPATGAHPPAASHEAARAG